MSGLMSSFHSNCRSNGFYKYEQMDAWCILTIYERVTQHDIGNCQPINHTSPISKLFETRIHDATNANLFEINLISPAQYVFQRARSCVNCHLNNFGPSVFNILCRFYFFNAFNIVSHSKRWTKLFAYGIRDPLTSWLHSFFLNLLKLITLLSSLLVILNEVFRPPHFIIYVYTIFDRFVHGKVFMFAIDLTVFKLFESSLLLDIDINGQICSISNFAKLW